MMLKTKILLMAHNDDDEEGDEDDDGELPKIMAFKLNPTSADKCRTEFKGIALGAIMVGGCKEGQMVVRSNGCRACGYHLISSSDPLWLFHVPVGGGLSNQLHLRYPIYPAWPESSSSTIPLTLSFKEAAVASTSKHSTAD